MDDRRERLRIWHNHDAVSVPGPNLLASRFNKRAMSAFPVLGGASLAAGDVQSTRIVYAMVIGLAVIGILFVLLGIWVIRQTRVDLEVLAPLERMGDREWRKSDPASQRRSLDESRPAGAEPLRQEQHRPRVDTEFEKSDRPVQSFEDLALPNPEGGDPTPTSGASLKADAGESVDLGDEPGSDAGNTDAKTKSDTDVEAEAEAEAESDIDTEPDADTESAEVDAKSDIDTEPDADAEADAEPEADAEGEVVHDEESDGSSRSEVTQPVEQ